MACNCKRQMVLEDVYGTRENETLLWKLNRYMWRGIMFPILIILACILVPVLVFIIVYKMVFNTEINIVLPKFLGKFLK